MQAGGKKFFKKATLFFIAFLIFQTVFPPALYFSARAEGVSVVINEIAWSGTSASANDEWIELFNNTSQEIDLTGWILAASDGQPEISLIGKIAGQGYFLLERTSDNTISDLAADQIYTGALSNSGEKLELKNSNGELVDSVDCSAGWFAGDNATKASMEKKRPAEKGGQDNWASNNGNIINNKDANNNSLMATPKAENSVYESSSGQPIEPPASGQGQTGSSVPPDAIIKNNTSFKLGDIIINELVADPGDGEEEWIELWNGAGAEINLTGWTIEEGSGSKTKLDGKIGAGGQEKYKIISKPKGNLNNAGDIIILRDPQGVLIDKVAYGDWNDGQPEDNAPAASDPASLARKFDGYNTYNNGNDFIKTLTPTKGAANIITTADEEAANTGEKNYEYSGDIIINEIFPNPEGLDTNNEFIEIFNKGGKDVNLLGWVLENENGKKFIISTSTVIKAKNYFVVYRKESKIILNNANDSVKLYEPLKEKYKEKIKYKAAKENFSFSRENSSDSWQWTEIITAGAENKIKTENHPPVADFYCPEKLLTGMPFIFDASDAVDEDDDSLKFKWDFGDGIKSDLETPEHTYLKQGNFTVKLSISDGRTETKKERIIKVVGFADEEIEAITEENKNTIIINEILPSPVGADEEGEWIEFFNLGNKEVNLNSWQVENGAKSYIFKKNKSLKPGGYYVLKRPESGLALKNSGGYLALFDGAANLLAELNYPSAKEGFSYGRDRYGKWLWTNILTPGKENIFTSGAGANASLKSVKLAAKGKKISRISSFAAPIKTTLEEVKNLDIGDIVNLKGTVAVLPGIFGVQYFYIVGSPALQIYNYKKDFPALAIGDYIEISGELSESSGELRLKTKEAGNIKLIERKEAPRPEETTCEKIGEEAVWRLVKIAGEVTGKKGSEVYLDDGESEAVLYLKRGSGLKASMFSEGDKIKVAGLAVNTKNGPRILPRSREDIEKINAAEEILGEMAATSTWVLAARDRKIELLKYLLVLSGGIIIVLIGWFIKLRKKS
jgi:DNA/RNA endonuclease YhcR with UshA esterase domain